MCMLMRGKHRTACLYTVKKHLLKLRRQHNSFAKFRTLEQITSFVSRKCALSRKTLALLPSDLTASCSFHLILQLLALSIWSYSFWLFPSDLTDSGSFHLIYISWLFPSDLTASGSFHLIYISWLFPSDLTASSSFHLILHLLALSI
jgi:hypothetical protein